MGEESNSSATLPVDKTSVQPGWMRWQILVLLMAFSFMSWLNRTSIAVAYTLRIQDQYGISEEQIGYVYSAFFLAYAVFMMPGGWLADRFGARAALILVGFGSALCIALVGLGGFKLGPQHVAFMGYSVAVLWFWLLVIRFVMGIFTAPIYPASGRAVGIWFPVTSRAGANGLITGAALVGNAGSFVLFGALIDRYGWPGAFLIASGVTALIAIAWWACARDNAGHHSRADEQAKNLAERIAEPADAATLASTQRVANSEFENWRKLLSNRSLLLLTVSYAAVGYFEYLFFFWMHHYFVKILKLGENQSRFYTCLALLAMAGGMVLGGRLCDSIQRRHGRRVARFLVASGGMLAGAVLLICGLFAGEPVWIVVWFSLALAAVGASEGPFWTTAIELGGKRSGTAFGIFNTGGNLGGLLAPAVTPFVCAHLPEVWHELLRWKIAISVGSLVCLLGAALWQWIDPRERISEID